MKTSAGKGSNRRPYDVKKYENNYDQINWRSSMDKEKKKELRKACSLKLVEIEQLKNKIKKTPMSQKLMLQLKKLYGVNE